MELLDVKIHPIKQELVQNKWSVTFYYDTEATNPWNAVDFVAFLKSKSSCEDVQHVRSRQGSWEEDLIVSTKFILKLVSKFPKKKKLSWIDYVQVALLVATAFPILRSLWKPKV